MAEARVETRVDAYGIMHYLYGLQQKDFKFEL